MLRTVTSFPTRLCLAASVLVCAASAFALAPPRADAASAADCGVRKLCLFSGPHYTGRMEFMTEGGLSDGDLQVVPTRVKGRVSSWINTTSLRVCGFRLPDEILWQGSRYTRLRYVGEHDNNETDAIKANC